MSNEDVREEGGYRDGSRILKLGKNIDKQRLDLDEDFKHTCKYKQIYFAPRILRRLLALH